MKTLQLALGLLSLYSVNGLEIVGLSPDVIIKKGLYFTELIGNIQKKGRICVREFYSGIYGYVQFTNMAKCANIARKT